MALVLTLAVGDVVDIADCWISVLSIDCRKSATLIAKHGEKIAISSKYETELAPTVWVQLGPWISTRNVKLLFDAPKSVSITRRKDKTIRAVVQAKSRDAATELKPAKSLLRLDTGR